jgi:hypothetical protein
MASGEFGVDVIEQRGDLFLESTSRARRCRGFAASRRERMGEAEHPIDLA